MYFSRPIFLLYSILPAFLCLLCISLLLDATSAWPTPGMSGSSASLARDTISTAESNAAHEVVAAQSPASAIIGHSRRQLTPPSTSPSDETPFSSTNTSSSSSSTSTPLNNATGSSNGNNATDPASAGRWKPGPKERGTLSILFSGTLTILLAVWSGILVNVQMAGGSSTKRSRYNDYIPHERPATKRVSTDENRASWMKSPNECQLNGRSRGGGTDHNHEQQDTTPPATTALTTITPEIGQSSVCAPGTTDPKRNKKNHKMKCLKHEQGQRKIGFISAIKYLCAPKTIFRTLAVKWMYKILWAVLTVLIPELTLVLTILELKSARLLLKTLREIDRQSGRHVFDDWDLRMAYYAIMGGFFLDIVDDNGEQTAMSIAEKDVDLFTTCPVFRRQQLDILMHHRDSIGRRLSSVNRNRIYFHAEKLKRKKQQSGNNINNGTKLILSEGRKNTPQKPREILTPHGLLYVAALCSFPKGEGADCNIPSSQPKEGRYAFVDHIPEDKKISHQDALKIQAQLNDMTSAILNDMSKGDWIAKVLFMGQALWMIIQVFARHFSDLPIVLLELHAAAQVGMAVVQYLIWWRKPIDVVTVAPITLRKKEFHNMIKIRTWEAVNPFRISSCVRGIISHQKIDFIPRDQSTEKAGVRPQPVSESSPDTPLTETPPEITLTPAIKDNQSHNDQIHEAPDKTDTTIASNPHISSPELTRTSPLSSLQKWWTDLLKLDESEELSNHYLTSQSTIGKYGYKDLSKQTKLQNQPVQCIVSMMLHLLFSIHRWPMLVLLWSLMAAGYGFIPRFAWEWHFPTEIERWIWKASTGFTMWFMGSMIVLCKLSHMYTYTARHIVRADIDLKSDAFKRENWVKRQVIKYIQLPQREWKEDGSNGTKLTISAKIRWYILDKLTWVILNGIRIVACSVVLLGPVWIIGRGFLLVEAYASLRSVEEGSYATLNWVEAIPHLG